MKKLLLSLCATAFCLSASAQCTDLFFSEYLEGTSNNKAFEVYNPTSNTVNLSNYKVYRHNNGSPVPQDSLLMQGTLAPGAVYIAGNPSAAAAITGVSDTLHTITFFNGDDVIWLKNIVTGDTLDIIGQIGVDPGVNWAVGSGATSEFTLVRMIGIQQGNTNWTQSVTEWDVYPQNTTTFLGSHSMTPCCAPVSATIASQTNIDCNGNANGSATASGSGGTTFTYIWSNGQITASATNLTGGVYTCTVTNECGNSDAVNVTITEPTALQSMAVPVQNVSCNGGADGSAIGTVFGGAPTYNISWAPDTSSSTLISGLSAGTYTMTATDANGCVTTSTVTITEPPLLQSAAVVVQNVSCNGDTDGVALGTVFGGTMAYTVVWTPSGDSTTLASGLSAGTYTMTVTDANGCSDSSAVTITEPAPLIVTLNLTNGDTVCQNAGILTLGGESPAGGVWSGTGISGNQFDPSAISPGYTYVNYLYTDGNNCSGSASDSLYVDVCNGFEDVQHENFVQVFPNPASSIININTATLPAGALIEIHDVTGRMVKSLLSTGNITTSDISSLAKGVYTIRIQGATKTFIKN